MVLFIVPWLPFLQILSSGLRDIYAEICESEFPFSRGQKADQVHLRALDFCISSDYGHLISVIPDGYISLEMLQILVAQALSSMPKVSPLISSLPGY